MCGICGLVNRKPIATAQHLLSMCHSIKHRGPDDEGYCLVENGQATSYAGPESVLEIKQQLPLLPLEHTIAMGMGFRRLSILDLSAAGHQPMQSADGNLNLTFNGQIYNYKALRNILKAQGMIFNTESDTEVVLRGYEYWGKEVVHHLNGMFAIAIIDVKAQTVFIARDRMGIKPLFYHRTSDGVTWASEMKALLKAPWIKAEINMEGLVANFYLQSSPTPSTCFKHIQSLPPAHWMEINSQTLETKIHQYWHIPFSNNQQHISLEDAAAELNHRLKEIVALQLNADVPVISMMSGGIDSTTITAMGKAIDPQLKCYSLGIDGTGNGMDELPQAMAMAQRLNIESLVQMVPLEELSNNLDEDLRFFEEPYTTPEVMLKPAAFLSERGYKVVLTGNGADELFGGYSHIFNLKKWQALKKWQPISKVIPNAHPFLKKAKHLLQVQTDFQFYANSRACMRPYQIQELLLPKDRQTLQRSYAHLLQNNSENFDNAYEALCHYELQYSVGSHHVYRDDLSAMRHSVELRYPYLDHTLVEWVTQLPIALRFNGTENKPLLRAAAAQYIEPVNLKMQKKGFNLPLESWWTHNKDIKAYMQHQIHLLMKRGIFNNKTIKHWLNNSNNAFELSKIWQLVTTELWLQTYID
jgi:asparagine synthase (glutamine-hydrolysing)